MTGHEQAGLPVPLDHRTLKLDVRQRLFDHLHDIPCLLPLVAEQAEAYQIVIVGDTI